MIKAYSANYVDDAGEMKIRTFYAETLEEAINMSSSLKNSGGVEFDLPKTVKAILFGYKIKSEDLILFLDTISEGVGKMGLSIRGSLKLISDMSETNPRLGGICDDIIEYQERGFELSDAIKITGVFPNMVGDMISVAESAGEVPALMDTMSTYYKETSAQMKKFIGQMVMPGMEIAMAFGVFLFFATSFIPSMVAQMNYEQIQPHLTSIAATTINLSFFVKDNMILFFFYILAPFATIYITPKLVDIPDSVNERIVHLPVIGRIIMLKGYVNFYSGMSVMLLTGTTIDDALSKLLTNTKNPYFRKGIMDAQKTLADGDGFSEGVKPFVDPYAYQVLRISEQAALLPERCKSLGEKYSAELRDKMDGIIKILNPIILISIGVMVTGLLLTVVGLTTAQRAAIM